MTKNIEGSLTSVRQNWKQAGREEDSDDDREAHQNEDGLAESPSSTSGDETMVKWRGNSVPEEKAKALKHLFDDLQDHFGHQRPDPKIKFNLGGLRRDDNTDLWYDHLSFTYMINGEACNLDYIGLDVCLDLTQKRSHQMYGGNVFDDYAKSWVYVYVPEMTLDKVKAYVKAGTGWDCSKEGTAFDPNRNLVAIKAKMHQTPQPEPSFWVAASDPKIVGEDAQFSRFGSVQHIGGQPAQQHVHRGVGIFAVTLEIPGSPKHMPSPGFVGEEANLSFTLISARTWGVTDCIAPIVHAPIRK